MSKEKSQALANRVKALDRLGFSTAEAFELFKIERTLHKWHEKDCNFDMERRGDKVFLFNHWARYLDPKDPRHWVRVRDMETAALKRLAAIMKLRPHLLSYVQGDPRGCALYIVEADKLDGHPIDCAYSRGVACYK